MSSEERFEDINGAKANLDHIYNQSDPRAYFGELRKLGYGIPGAAKPIFQSVISDLRQRQDMVRVLDLGCSYGVNAALLKRDMSMSDLYEHWGQAQLAEVAPQQVVASDRQFFDRLDQADDLEMIGLDQAENAVAFAEETGLLDGGIVANLETRPLPGDAEQDLAPVDLVISTGCIGYVTEKSFERLLPALAAGGLPWMANFVLRMFPFDAIEQTLSDRGYVTQKLEGRTFPQRRFASEGEQELVLRQLRDHELDPAGKEADGHLHAELYLSRPAPEAGQVPLAQLVAA